MELDKTIFRRYDVRGIYPSELNEDVAYKIGLAFANLFPDTKTIVVGGDIRKSTPALKDAIIRGLLDGGKEVIDTGIVITQLLYFAVCHYKYDAGIIITASHLEGVYNGIKMVSKNASPTMPDDYEKIMNLILNNKLKKVEKPEKKIKKIDPEEDYIEYLFDKFHFKKPIKLVIDTGNGTARLLPEKIFKKLGCEVTTIFAKPDDSFPNHISDPYKEENMEDLKKKVLEKKADLGIAYDGDGDRAGFVDSDGNFLSGDDLLMIFTKDAFKQKLGPIAVDSRASMALINEVKKSGQKIELAVGYHAAVLAKLIEIDAVFGGETTGHFYFPLECYLTDDGLFASLKMAQIVSEQENFPEYLSNLPRYYTSEEIFIEFPDTTKYQTVDKFTKMAEKRGLDVNDVDGARISFKNGWGIVRAANTSPFIKVKFEGKIKEDMIDVANKMLKLMEKVNIIMPEELKKKIK